MDERIKDHLEYLLNNLEDFKLFQEEVIKFLKKNDYKKEKYDVK